MKRKENVEVEESRVCVCVEMCVCGDVCVVWPDCSYLKVRPVQSENTNVFSKKFVPTALFDH